MSIKTVATFAIIIGCFAVLYPKFLHPMMIRLFGLQSKSAHDIKDGASQYYPPGRRPEERHAPHMPPPQAGDIRQHMRPGPHPGMRAAAEMHRQQSQHGSGRGMMGIVLPMYAVGIVLYLVYTLVKVFGKKDKSLQSGDGHQSRLSDYHSSPTLTANLTPQQRTNELQNLLLKADDKSISNEEMKELQRRLEETEVQMSNILKAMQLVQNKIDPDIKNQADTNQGSCPDSSPDMDSYEIVNKSKKTDEQRDDRDVATPDIDNLKAEEGKSLAPKPSHEILKRNMTKASVEKGHSESQYLEEDTVDRYQSLKEDDSEVSDDVEDAGEDAEEQDMRKVADNQTGVDAQDLKCLEELSEEGNKCHEEEMILHSSEDDSDLGSNVRHRQVPPSCSH